MKLLSEISAELMVLRVGAAHGRFIPASAIMAIEDLVNQAKAELLAAQLAQSKRLHTDLGITVEDEETNEPHVTRAVCRQSTEFDLDAMSRIDRLINMGDEQDTAAINTETRL